MGKRKGGWWCWYCNEDREDGIYHKGSGGTVEICSICGTYFCKDYHGYKGDYNGDPICIYCGEDNLLECDHCGEEFMGEDNLNDHLVKCEYCGEECCENSLDEHYEVCDEYESESADPNKSRDSINESDQ
jgi:hypothetical protein